MSPSSLLLCTLLCALIAFIASDCTGKPNTKPFITSDPKFISEVPNGKRYFAGDQEHPLHIVHVYGSPYEMGKAYGQLLKDEIKPTITEYRDYLNNFIEKYIPKIPKKLADIIIQFGLNAALDLTWEMTRLYTPQRYIDELHGIADGAGMDWVELRRLCLLPELIKADCTIIGGWGEATRNSTTLNGNVYQVRALDWDAHATIKKYPVATVYHPSEKGSHAFVNVAWPGFIGSLTGVSEAMIGISEKVWLTKSEHSRDTRFGTPWTYVLRDLLQYATDLDSALNMLINANRTCSIHLGVGSSVSNTFRGVEYSYRELNVYDWSTEPAYDGHPQLRDVVYWDKHVQPSKNPCLGGLLQEHHGKLDPETTIRQITAVHETGDMQIAVYDFSNKKLYVSNAGPDSDPEMEAWKRSFIVLDTDKLFGEKL